MVLTNVCNIRIGNAKTRNEGRAAFQACVQSHGPGKTSFDNPAAWQQDKAFLGFGQFDHDQINATGFGILLRLLAGVAFIDKSDFHGILSDSLDIFRQLLHLGIQERLLC